MAVRNREAQAAPSDEKLPDWMMDLRKRLQSFVRFGSFEVHHQEGHPKSIRFQFEFGEKGYAEFIKSVAS